MLYKTQKYFDYLENFESAKCPVCSLIEKWRSSYIETFLYECVNDRSMRKRIRETGGFCRDHARAMLKKGDPLGHSIIYTALIDEYIEAPDKKMKKGCLMCDLEEKHLDMLLRNFMDSFANSDEFRNKFSEKKACVCRPHLKGMKTLKKGRDVKTVIEMLNKVQFENLRKAQKCLDEIIRKHDYRFNGEQLTDEEKEAWQNAVRLMIGS